jgi:hypothetical protein
MSNSLVKRLRNWEHVYLEDENKAEGSLYLEAADRIEELEAKLETAIESVSLLGKHDGVMDDDLFDLLAELKGDKE